MVNVRKKRCKYMQQYIEVSIMLFKSNFHMSRPRVCVCGCVRSRSGCVFWFVSCIEPVGAYLKLIICNVSILHRGFPRHKGFIYIDLCLHCSALVFTVILLFFTYVLRFLHSSSSAALGSAWFHASHLPVPSKKTTPSHKCNVFVAHSVVKVVKVV